MNATGQPYITLFIYHQLFGHVVCVQHCGNHGVTNEDCAHKNKQVLKQEQSHYNGAATLIGGFNIQDAILCFAHNAGFMVYEPWFHVECKGLLDCNIIDVVQAPF